MTIPENIKLKYVGAIKSLAYSAKTADQFYVSSNILYRCGIAELRSADSDSRSDRVRVSMELFALLSPHFPARGRWQ